MSRKQVAESLKVAEKKGWIISQTRKGHHKLEHPLAERAVFFAGTPSDYRSVLNSEAELKRVLRHTEPETVVETEVSHPKPIRPKPPARELSYKYRMPTRPPTPNEVRLEEDLIEARAAWWGSLPERALPKAWGLAILRLRSERKDWDMVTIMKQRVRTDDEFRVSMVEAWLDTSATAIEALRVGLRTGFQAPKPVQEIRNDVVMHTQPQPQVLSEVTIIPVEPPDPAIRKLREARDRIADLEGRIAGLEILVIGAKNEAQDMLLAERQRRLYAERARDDALQTLADEKEARRTAERDLRTLRQTIPMALAAAQNPLPKAAVVLAPVQNPLPKPAVVQARIDAAAAALPPVAAPGAVPPPATAPVVTALAPFVPVVGKKLGAQIIARRKELGMSQSALANEMKADKSLVRNWEMDVYYPSQPKLEALNRVLGITLQGNPDSIPSVEYLSSAEIAAKRRALRINQPDMARRAGVGLTAYTKWEQGRSRPSPKNMAALLAAFDAMPVPEPEPEVTQAAVPTAPEPPWLTGAELRTRRDAVGVKRIDLARLAGVSPTMVSHWEHDRYKIARKHRDAIEAALASPKPTQPAQAPRPPKAPPAPAPAPESSSFAVDIYAKRKERQLSQDALGELVGVTGVSIHNWEKGRTAPSEEKQAALLKVFAKIKPKVDMPKRILLTPVAPKPEPKPAPVAPVAPGNDVLSRRTALGLSQNRLGEMVGLTGSAIGMIERHNYAAPQRTLVAITGALDRVAATRAVVPAPAVKRPYSTSNKPVNWWSRA